MPTVNEEEVRSSFVCVEGDVCVSVSVCLHASRCVCVDAELCSRPFFPAVDAVPPVKEEEVRLDHQGGAFLLSRYPAG